MLSQSYLVPDDKLTLKQKFSYLIKSNNSTSKITNRNHRFLVFQGTHYPLFHIETHIFKARENLGSSSPVFFYSIFRLYKNLIAFSIHEILIIYSVYLSTTTCISMLYT